MTRPDTVGSRQGLGVFVHLLSLGLRRRPIGRVV